MMVPCWPPLRTWWWSPSSTAWVSWASSALETSMQPATGATWTKWPHYAGSSRISPALEATLTVSPFLASLRVARVCLHLLCPPCPKDSSMGPSWRVAWPCCLASLPAQLMLSPR
uniref:Secreted protein n=1 Tax=Theropithecus gelada TaxID=9565 RepID=A0A8D2E6U8_THEGE